MEYRLLPKQQIPPLKINSISVHICSLVKILLTGKSHFKKKVNVFARTHLEGDLNMKALWKFRVLEKYLDTQLGVTCQDSSGGDALRLDTILEWWREKNGSFCSRLIILLDCENSQPWVKEVRKVGDLYIAIQGAELAKVVDIDAADLPRLGDFTREWVEYNCNPDSDIRWAEKGRTVKAVYGVSKRWSDYSLHLPSESDVAKHWMLYFPRITYPLIHLANWFCGLNLFWICKACFRCLKRLKMSWFLPTVLDTGQGFKLVRS